MVAILKIYVILNLMTVIQYNRKPANLRILKCHIIDLFFQQCLEVVEENDEAILKQFMADVTPSNIEEIICTDTAAYCGEADVEDDEFGDNSQDGVKEEL